MSLQPLYQGSRFLGYELYEDDCHYFFGSAAVTREELPVLYPNYQFYFLKQVHGRALVPAHPSTTEADGHWTSQADQALVIQTADCLPVLFGGSKMVMAVHAGWRGIEQDILLSSAAHWREKNLQPRRILIGPHIGKSDFEVGRDVAEKLQAAFYRASGRGPGPLLPHPNAEKSHADLALIALCQIQSVLGPEAAIEVSEESTFTSSRFHSYRRSKASGGRQYSFIVRRSKW